MTPLPALAKHFATLAIALALAAPIGAAQAATIEIEVFGHRLRTSAGLDHDGSEPTLTFGGTITLKEPVVSIEKIDRIKDSIVILGSAGPGGNACNAAPFLIAFRPGEDPKLFGPLDTCNETTITQDRDSLTIRERGLVGDTIRTWTFTQEDGLTRAEAVKAPEPGKGWASLWDRKITHPSELLESAEITAVLSRLLGRDFGAYRRQMTGLGSARFEGDFLIGTACQKLDCEATGAFTGLDLQTRAAYAAFKPVGGRIAVSPPVGQWPETLRGALREWARGWR